MAPKRARAAGSSSRRSSSDADSSLGYTGNKFTSPAAHAEYTRLMGKSVIKERGFLPTASSGELLTMVLERGWEVICEAPIAVPLSIVREFYANAKTDRNGFSWVRGITVDYRVEEIRRILNQPPKKDGDEDWVLKTRADVDLDYIVSEICVPGTVWKRKAGSNDHIHFPATALNRYARAWFLFICANLMPSSHTTDVTVDRAILLWGILNGEYIDVGYLIHRNLVRYMIGGTTGGIPHASIVTKLCTSVGIRWAEDELVQMPGSAIDHVAIRRLVDWPGGTPDERGLGYIAVEAEGDSPPHGGHGAGGSGSSYPHFGDTSGLGEAQFRRLTRRVDASHDISRRFAEDMTRALDSVFQTQGIQVPWPTFGAHAVYPPPDTPPAEGDDYDD